MMLARFTAPIVVVTLALLSTIGCGQPHANARAPAPREDVVPEVVRLVPRTLMLEHYPCSECHDAIDALTGRRPATHRSIRLEHMPGGRCTLCHSQDNMGALALLSGETTSFDEPAALCAQCHFREEADWHLGVHGKQVGRWQGNIRDRYQCVSCHDAHSPRFGAMKPLPPPKRPEFGLKKKHLEAVHQSDEGKRSHEQ